MLIEGYAGISKTCVAAWRDEKGVTSIEYGLLAALIAVACIAAFQGTGMSLDQIYRDWSRVVLAAL